MVALKEPDIAPEKTECDETAIDAADPSVACAEDAASENTPEVQGDSSAGIGEHSDLLFPTVRRNNRLRQIVRGLVKPLLAVATAQYALVTIIAGLTAYAVATNASKLVNANLEPLIAALKRL